MGDGKVLRGELPLLVDSTVDARLVELKNDVSFEALLNSDVDADELGYGLTGTASVGHGEVVAFLYNPVDAMEIEYEEEVNKEEVGIDMAIGVIVVRYVVEVNIDDRVK